MPDQSMSFSGGQFSGVQIGQAGGDLTQNQELAQDNTPSLSPEKVVELIAEIEYLFLNSDLPDDTKKQAFKHLDYAKDAVQEKEPDKNTAVSSLQKASKVLKDANETLSAGQGIWQKLKPIVKELAPWLGITAKTLLLLP